MANVTRIKAKDPGKPKDETPEAEKPTKKEENLIKTAKKQEQKAKKSKSEGKKTFILFRPFVALGRYLKNSWKELRQVRWPNRKATWKMVLAVFVYTLVFVVFLVLLDLLFDFIFSKILG